ncbi:alpha/beta hydrolase, partial [Streptomyces sp. SID625]|nr:alpha/beta hydrolase [Streptomyces sp. SID625]
MSKAQRVRLDAMLRQAARDFRPLPVEQMRSDFAALMALFPVPEARVSDVVLGERFAVLVEPEGEVCAGTILYFHGGSFSMGSPRTAMGLTVGLVTRTGFRGLSLD